MSEKQFKLLSGGFDEKGNPLYLIKDTTDMIGDYEICKKVIEQQATIYKLDQENADLLGARIKAQEEWEKCTDKLKEKIVGQQATITAQKKGLDEYMDNIIALSKENEQLRQTNEKLRWDLEKTRTDLEFFATLKVTAMKGYEPMDEATNLEHQTWTGGKR